MKACLRAAEKHTKALEGKLLFGKRRLRDQTRYIGVELTSENSDEAMMLRQLYNNGLLPWVLTRKRDGNVAITIVRGEIGED